MKELNVSGTIVWMIAITAITLIDPENLLAAIISTIVADLILKAVKQSDTN